MIMLHGDFQLQKVLPKINVARKLNVKKSCNEEFGTATAPPRPHWWSSLAQPVRILDLYAM